MSREDDLQKTLDEELERDARQREYVAELEVEIENFEKTRRRDRSVALLLVDLAGLLGMECEVGAEEIVNRAISYVKGTAKR